MPPHPLTPAAALALLEPRLSAQQREIQTYENYYDGKHPLAFATAKFREAFGSMFGVFADNWCEIVVDAVVERLEVQGFRFGQDDTGDNEAWAIWQENGLDLESELAHTEAVKCGRAYVIVDPSGPRPRITVEHAAQVTVAHAAGDRRVRLAALKKWRDDDGYVYANVYLPDGVAKYRSQEKPKQYGGGSRINWMRRPDDPGGGHSLNVVPVVPLYNRPTMLGGGQSDLKNAIPLQNAINKEALDMLVASEFAAFPQRVLTGVEMDLDPETGQPLKAAQQAAALSRLWTFENENAKWGQFQAADLGNYVTAIGMLVQHFSAQTRTPPHYLLGQIVNASGDALKAAEIGLVKRARRKHRPFGEGWEEAMRLSFRALGDQKRADATAAQTVWADPEEKTPGETTDALLKQRTLGVPLEVLWAALGYSPQDIQRMKTQAGLPERPPPGATTSTTPPVLGGTNGAPAAGASTTS